ncbi:MAG TPA: thiol:disulfide interchange protein DsbA/DsbL [Rhodocyclaceae bacterium]
MRFLKTLIAALSLGLIAAAAGAAPVEGKDYTVVNPALPSDTPGKIEVVEFFWYGCPHCAHFEPILNQWAKKLPKDAVLRPVPAPLNPSWVAGAKLFYALDALGQEGKLRDSIFTAIHETSEFSPNDERNFPTWLAKKGVDAAKFSEVYGSFTIQSKLQRAGQLARSAGISGTPSIVIGGRYRIDQPAGMPPQQFAELADFLVAKARKDAGK